MKDVRDLYVISENQIRFFLFREQVCTMGQMTPMRTYDEYLKFFRVVGGRATWAVEDQRYEVSAGDFLIMNNAERRTRTKIAENEPLILEYIQFLPIFLYPHQKCAFPFFYRPEGFRHRIPKESPAYAELDRVFSEIRQEATGQKPYQKEAVFGLLLQLLVLVGRAFRSSEMPAEMEEYGNLKNFNIISDAVQFITQNPYEDLSLEALSKRYFVSKFYFSHLFRMYNGINLSSYVKRCRIHYAIRLITEGNEKIADAAFASGFGCLSGVYTAFRDVTGMTPSEVLSKRNQFD